MRLWSKGLGNLELPLDFASAEIEPADEHLLLRGRIIEGKVNWNYLVALQGHDLVGFASVAGDPRVLELLARTRGLGFLFSLVTPMLRFALGLFGSFFSPRRLPAFEPRAGEPTGLG